MEQALFDPADRQALLDRLIRKAEADPRIVSGAVVGSLTTAEFDRWSDIDLTFAVDADDTSEVFDAWTAELEGGEGAVVLFDLVARGTRYRVYLLPNGLQVDLSFRPHGRVRKGSPRFELLFGEFDEQQPEPPDAAELAGFAVHLAHFARVCIERGRLLQAEWSIAECRSRVMSLACLGAGLPAQYGRGLDQLPADRRRAYDAMLVRSIERGELDRALSAVISQLRSHTGPGADLIARVDRQLALFQDPVA
jgi:hypothetical protein